MPFEIRRDCCLENRDPEAFYRLNWANIEAYFCGQAERLVLVGADAAKYQHRPSVVCIEYEADREFERLLESFERNVIKEVERRKAYRSLDITLRPVEFTNSCTSNLLLLPTGRGHGTLMPKERRYGHILSTEERNELHDALKKNASKEVHTDSTPAELGMGSIDVHKTSRNSYLGSIAPVSEGPAPQVKPSSKTPFWSKLKVIKREKGKRTLGFSRGGGILSRLGAIKSAFRSFGVIRRQRI
ncbi:hypothetical protein AOL_s00076g432 [Orbilia oligospora ATCC 24927]|uniref:Uncharacterized protein n=2 Tax=Orbilia oligospora TaxID=2813651 RepID=G1X9U3_ARTOA|nr:hypothetical protein AOL_s00076g432 [Orbilia oligospora ATCC 24927]EGX50081.1 hypothetical protein AOL_s00076g432 [Orbilia oligospora ATCC 24927]KAF3275879.1 hypothetical protein TWF970_006491 [Orbilia oligospora]